MEEQERLAGDGEEVVDIDALLAAWMGKNRRGRGTSEVTQLVQRLDVARREWQEAKESLRKAEEEEKEVHDDLDAL